MGGYRWRPLTASDADTAFVVRLRNDPRFARWFYRRQITPELHRKFVAAADERGEINWVVERDDDHREPVGVAAIYNIDEKNAKAECGRTIFLEPRAFHLNWVVSAHVCFDLLGLNKAYIETLADNRIIARGVARLGMTAEALLRQHVIDDDGRPRDVLLYTILADEWRAIRAATGARWGTPKFPMDEPAREATA
jgi:RimJ/RimL family protein N-acetyltransferase